MAIVYTGTTYTHPNIKAETGVGFAFNMTGKFPLEKKRIFETKEQAQAYIDNKADSAIEGLILTVTGDTTASKNGAYFVSKVADTTTSGGTLVKLADGASTDISVSALTEPTSGYLKSYQLYQNGQAVGATIDIPKDFLVKEASVKVSSGVTETDGQIPSGHTYMDFVINVKDSGTTETTNEHLRVDMNALVDDFTPISTDEIELAFSGNSRNLYAKVNQIASSAITTDYISASTESVEISGTTVAEQLQAIGIQIKKAANNANISGGSAISVTEAVSGNPESGRIIELKITSGETGSIFAIYKDGDDTGLGLASGATWDCGEW